MAVRLAKGTSPWFYVAWLAVVATAALALLVSAWWWVAFAPILVLALIMLNFFRDPDRTPAGRGLIASADGVVQSIDAWPDGRTRVATFMNPFDVHVNRAPIAGRITSVEHVRGGFIPAFNKESDQNERVVWHLETEIGDIEIHQIAGTVARRIVPYLPAGAKVALGDRIGIIRLGSRVDVYLPPGIAPAVKVGDRMVAGETVLAVL